MCQGTSQHDRDILAHGIIDFHPAPIGPPEVTADHMQEWFEYGAQLSRPAPHSTVYPQLTACPQLTAHSRRQS
ncbi:hypothetical protein F7230_06485 [Corynebacterium sp. 320]|uniref:hypothetical protein n=1 Tax=Corynebacterium TaxID=1716 RepID=UPI00125CA722|nr:MULTISPECIES: hypothetical protein [Corynebacterium]KAB1503178.1 hypothetical protein F7230_06485 [Corynebacterium sp. 320]KAB1550609.1 hypothetical protein F7233_08700 [Corynebacterium sp. 321]KAB1550970.1 hypothetical protein F7232_07880 [Corynebacterium sp. 319]KAB3526975.1 hypothetical protein F8354_06485 [Corynebacterium sp. 250]KAB3538467.1 hypothetical protein F8390_09385 [Corynebacterium sp. 366]